MMRHNDLFKRLLLTGFMIILGMTAARPVSAQSRPYPLLKKDTLSRPAPLSGKAPLYFVGNEAPVNGQPVQQHAYTYQDYAREYGAGIRRSPARNNHFRWNDITAVTEMALSVYILFR
ncbi:MAG: hypothetical protein J7623_19695 [Chitinophaga sp.]|uniref:hypothetical protein n=1 Tax=Chitinophaga sp. TaxID=1869181 RepID=UPI001B0E0784|nr:hypothetical protein [Chitinophaga sp.]MBO9730873.1 hypothetical protein [Chitinophaga sp.]